MPSPAQRLIHAVRTGNHDRLRALIRDSKDINARSAAGRTALHAAAEEGDLEAARILIEAGADVNARMTSGETPLQIAAAYGGSWNIGDPDLDRRDPCRRNRHHPTHPEVAEAITEIIKKDHPELPAELRAQDQVPEENRGEMFLGVLECFTNTKELHQKLQARGVDVDRLDPHFADSLLGNPRFLRVVELLLDHGADLEAEDESGNSALWGAVERGRPEMVELLLQRGARIQESSDPENASRSLIEAALTYSSPEVAEVLLKHGAAFHPESSWALHEAAGNGREQVVHWLLEHGADVNRRNDEGDTALLLAVSSGHHSLIRPLISRGPDVRARNDKGIGLLHAAATWPGCLTEVLPLGLPVDEPDGSGETALHHAAHGAVVPAIQSLLRAGASIHLQNRDGNTPLHCVFLSEEFRPDVEFPAFHALVSAGADRAVRNSEGKTAHDLAVEFLYPGEYRQLLDPAANADPALFLWLGAESYAGFLPRAMIPFELDGVEWPSATHYFHSQKTQDPAIREYVRQAKTPDAAVGRLRDHNVKTSRTWPRRCDGILRTAQRAKFRQNDALRQQLLSTGNAVLVSDAHCDSYWFENKNAGFNAVGRMLMNIRDELRKAEEAS